MTTRREIITKCGTGLASILAARRAPAALVRSMLAARNTTLPGNVSLPYKKQVAYIQSSGTQYIDTGVVPTASTNCFVRFETLMLTGSTAGGIMGSRIAASNASWLILQYYNYTTSRQAYRYDYGSGNSALNIFSDRLTAGVHTLRTSGKTAYYDESSSVSASTTFVASNLSAYLFAVNTNGSPSLLHPSLRLHAVQISDSALVRDYIPVVDFNDDACMYDRVSGTCFYTPVGAFIAGPDV